MTLTIYVCNFNHGTAGTMSSYVAVSSSLVYNRKETKLQHHSFVMIPFHFYHCNEMDNEWQSPVRNYSV